MAQDVPFEIFIKFLNKTRQRRDGTISTLSSNVEWLYSIEAIQIIRDTVGGYSIKLFDVYNSELQFWDWGLTSIGLMSTKHLV